MATWVLPAQVVRLIVTRSAKALIRAMRRGFHVGGTRADGSQAFGLRSGCRMSRIVQPPEILRAGTLWRHQTGPPAWTGAANIGTARHQATGTVSAAMPSSSHWSSQVRRRSPVTRAA